jgi:hypothetical protein
MIILKCILEKKKLRIKFHCFINDENKIYNNVYNNNYNCKFPKDIRENGRYYKVNDNDISLTNDSNKQTFYNINKKHITIMTEEEVNTLLNPIVDVSNLKIFDAGECIICMEVDSKVIFIPCAHRCVCVNCYESIKKIKNCCPICRRDIIQTVIENE